MSQGCTISFDRGVTDSIAWSPSGRYIAVLTQNDGVWVLDLEHPVLFQTPVHPSYCRRRPVWGPGDRLYIRTRELGVQLVEHTGGEWKLSDPDADHDVDCWDELAGYICDVPMYEIGERAKACSEQIRLEDGRSIHLAAPGNAAWWCPGESVVVAAYADGYHNYLIDVRTGISAPLNLTGCAHDGVLLGLSGAYASTRVVGMLEQSEACRDDRVLVVDVRATSIVDDLSVPRWFANHRLSIAPDGRNLAVIDEDCAISIVTLAHRS